MPNFTDVEVPKRMRTLARDKRGYPVPFIVMIDKTKTPQFTINDHQRVGKCLRRGLCGICGKPFDRTAGTPDMWFVGGTRCFLHEHGGFIDPPSHLECAEYALRVCPFLAARRYSKRIDDRKMAADAMPDGMALMMAEAMQPSLPERFGLGLTHRYEIARNAAQGLVMTVADWRYIEWWRAGEPVEAPDSGQPPPDQDMIAA